MLLASLVEHLLFTMERMVVVYIQDFYGNVGLDHIKFALYSSPLRREDPGASAIVLSRSLIRTTY